MKPRDSQYDAALKAVQKAAKKAYWLRYYREHKAERAAYYRARYRRRKAEKAAAADA